MIFCLILHVPGEVLDINGTSDSQTDVWVTSAGRKSLTFMVAAKSDATIVLSEYFKVSSYRAYQIILGVFDNMQSIIWRAGNDTVYRKTTQYLLDDDTPSAYWMTWIGGMLQVGEGLVVGERGFMAWQDPQPLQVNHVAFTTAKRSQGRWLFIDTPGCSLFITVTALRYKFLLVSYVPRINNC